MSKQEYFNHEFEEVRTRFVREYVVANNLDIVAYKDFGWDPVPLFDEGD